VYVTVAPPPPTAGIDEPEPEDPVSVAVTEDALTPLPAPIDGERPPPEDATPLPVATDTIEETMLLPTMLPTLLAKDEVTVPMAVVVEAVEPAELVAVELAELVTAEQLRSKRGVVLNVLPTIPKLGLGVLPASESERVYQ